MSLLSYDRQDNYICNSVSGQRSTGFKISMVGMDVNLNICYYLESEKVTFLADSLIQKELQRGEDSACMNQTPSTATHNGLLLMLFLGFIIKAVKK